MNKKELIEEIAKKHHIILDENDPILAVVSANEIIFDDFLKKIDLLFIKHKTDLESYKFNIFNEIREYSKSNQEILKDILTQAQTNQNTTKPPQEKTEDTKEKKNTNINFLIIAIASQIIFLLVGLIIGITI
ncbi:conjugal transfer protein TraM [Campylobacter coli]|uniref:conjugal transfer protein TraM n=1 Tax=Campylobacter coli TaxID=195 RepID=UPI00092E68F5|nr:conjugal transfer protein TraM [Campylobacter coli]EAJ7826549.1 conjugal transfer protein TraM [Campylobacter coli]ELM5630640.1 conjugal transfer protein TraM [Campylobacter coli]ELV6878631.1 conjugal transfer protein TraM [Campylobacter coli]ELX8850390.1 conjugal transfer protein TraM [Campylobacter coli]HED8237530.1 conjugal transfer protein TraM [Campylobacter coli]